MTNGINSQLQVDFLPTQPYSGRRLTEQIDIPRCLGKTDAASADRAVNVVNLVSHHFSERCEPCGLSN